MFRRRIDEEWKRLYLFQEKFRSENKVTASDLLVHYDLPLSLLQYLYSVSIPPSNKIWTLGKSLRDNLINLEKNAGSSGCDIPKGQDPEFDLREIYEQKKDIFSSFGVDVVRLGDDNSIIIDTTPSLGITLDEVGVKNLLKETQFEEFRIVVAYFTFL